MIQVTDVNVVLFSVIHNAS